MSGVDGGDTRTRAARRNAERQARQAEKRMMRDIRWRGVKAGGRPYTPIGRRGPLNIPGEVDTAADIHDLNLIISQSEKQQP